MRKKLNAVLYERPDWINSDLYPFESNWLNVDGHVIHYVDEGPSNAPVILFLHPGPAWSFAYRYQIRELRSDFRCVALDFPGYGLSEAREDYGFSLLEQARVLERFVLDLDLKQIILWANDGGGPTGILALSKYSERVIGLVVGGTFGWSIRPYKKVSVSLLILTSGPFRLVNRYSNFLARTLGSKRALGSRTLSKEETRHYILPYRDRNKRNNALRLFRSFLNRETQDELDEALPSFRKKSALIQFGDKDPVTSLGWPERWAESFERAEIKIIPNVAHFTFEGDPVITTQNFRNWWSNYALTVTGFAKSNLSN
jgi:haloalkane dehalogenase